MIDHWFVGGVLALMSFLLFTVAAVHDAAPLGESEFFEEGFWPLCCGVGVALLAVVPAFLPEPFTYWSAWHWLLRVLPGAGNAGQNLAAGVLVGIGTLVLIFAFAIAGFLAAQAFLRLRGQARAAA